MVLLLCIIIALIFDKTAHAHCTFYNFIIHINIQLTRYVYILSHILMSSTYYCLDRLADHVDSSLSSIFHSIGHYNLHPLFVCFHEAVVEFSSISYKNVYLERLTNSFY